MLQFMVRSFHKYLSLFISIQLLLWTVSGIYFSFNKIELIRGEQYLSPKKDFQFDMNELNLKLTAKNVSVFKRLNKWIVKVETNSGTYYTNTEGDKLDELSSDEAMQAVRDHTSLIPVKAIRITNSNRGSEYRGRSLPLFKVSTSSEENVNVYIDAVSGEVQAIRSNSWRIWDFFWGTHIMDYRERENIDNLFLKIFSILALISALSGIMLFFLGRQRKAAGRSK